MNAVIFGLSSIGRTIRYLKKPESHNQGSKDHSHTEGDRSKSSVENLD